MSDYGDGFPGDSRSGQTRLRVRDEHIRGQESRILLADRERHERERRFRGLTKSSYVPGPAMAKLIRERLARVEVPIGSTCERHELER